MNYSLVHTKLTGPVEPMHSGLSCLSLDHKSADLALLERVERHTPDLAAAISDATAGAVVLATCNRFEAYFDAPPGAPSAALRAIADVTGVPEEVLTRSVRVHRGVDAARHLFSVSSGLESVVVGEGEISGQVRRAFTAARRAGATTPELERLFQTASRVSRSVKTRTLVQSQGRSLVRLALLLAESRIGDWSEARVLLVGTGAYAAVTLAALRERGARHIAVFSPSGRAEEFARTRNVRPIPSGAPGSADSDAIAAELAAADIIIACSTAQDPILDSELISRTITPAARPFCARFTGRPAGAARPRRRLFIDLGMPRNIASEAALVPGTELLDLEVIARHANLEELSAEAEARQITLDAAREFAEVGAERAAVPAILALRDHVNAVLEAEIERTERATQAAAQAGSPVVQSALRHFAGRLLHEPTVRIRELGRAGRAAEAIAAVHALYGVPGPSPTAAAAAVTASPPLAASTP